MKRICLPIKTVYDGADRRLADRLGFSCI